MKCTKIFIILFLVTGITVFGIPFVRAENIVNISVTGNATLMEDALAETPATILPEKSGIAGTKRRNATMEFSVPVLNQTVHSYSQIAGTMIPDAMTFSDSTTSVKVIMVSNTTTQSVGYTNTLPSSPLNVSGYSNGSWSSAAEVTRDSNWYNNASAPFGSGAVWISSQKTTEGGNGDQWRLFKTDFDIAAGATLTSAKVWYTGDNAAAVYLNDVEIDSTGSVYETPSGAYIFSKTYTVNFTPDTGSNSLKFVVRNWQHVAYNPTGLLYKAMIEYEPPIPPVVNFSATPTSGDSPLTVQFNDISTGGPTSWNWSFGDGKYSNEQNPLHTYVIGQKYTVSLTAGNASLKNTETKMDYISATCPSYVSCDVTLTNPPYINFGIDNVTFPGDSGVWRRADCYSNALIRWAMAGESSSFTTRLLPWMWKRNPCCQNPGYSYAVDAPANKHIYIAAVTNPDADVYFHHHAVDAEYLGINNNKVRHSEWGDWTFFNYHELNITPGWDKQIPNGTLSFWTEVVIGRVDELPNVGQYRGDIMRTFYIAPNSTAYLHPREYYTETLLKSQVENPDLIRQKVSDEIINEIRTMKSDSPFTINNWEFDSTKKELVVYVHDIKDRNVIGKLDRRFNNNYSVRIVYDTEFEEIREDVEQQFVDLRQNPKYQIAWIGTVTDTNEDVPKKYIDLWVYQSTPENEKIDNTVIRGWTIHVHPISK